LDIFKLIETIANNGIMVVLSALMIWMFVRLAGEIKELLNENKNIAVAITEASANLYELRNIIESSKSCDKVIVEKTIDSLKEIVDIIRDRNFMSDGDFRDSMMDSYFQTINEITLYILEIVDRNDIKRRFESIIDDILTTSQNAFNSLQTKTRTKHYYEDVKYSIVADSDGFMDAVIGDLTIAFGKFQDHGDYEVLKRKIRDIRKDYCNKSCKNIEEKILNRTRGIL
jgi:hypothetical protein